MKWYFIEPGDTLFFRDGKPFWMGQDTQATSIFPPFPSTLYGALRAFVLSSQASRNDFREGKILASDDVIGTKSEYGSLKINGPFLAETNDRELFLYFPLPADLGVDSSDSLRILKPIQVQTGITDLTEVKSFPMLPSEMFEPLDGLMSSADMFAYLSGDTNFCIADTANEFKQYFSDKRSFLIQVEGKVGLKKASEGVAKESHLFFSQHTRLGSIYHGRGSIDSMKKGFIFQISDETSETGSSFFPETFCFRFGGETRYVNASTIESSFLERLFDPQPHTQQKEDNESVHFKAVLISPAVFEKNGWYPDFLSKSNDTGMLEGTFHGLKLRLHSVCLKKPIPIGGYDLMKKAPKDVMKAIPAGSVFYFEVIKDNSSNSGIKKALINLCSHDQNISQRTKEGFGQALVGRW